MKRRNFLTNFSTVTGAALLSAHAPGWAQAVATRASGVQDRILILIELKGGNDGLNTVIPFADNAYYQLRNTIGIKPDELIKLDEKVGLHPDLKAMLPFWEKNELAIVQGVGYPQANLSHFRSIEIWDTASKSNEYLGDGWATRAMQAGYAAKGKYAAEGVLIGMAAVLIVVAARERLLEPRALPLSVPGLLVTAFSSLLNFWLARYLIGVGRAAKIGVSISPG